LLSAPGGSEWTPQAGATEGVAAVVGATTEVVVTCVAAGVELMFSKLELGVATKVELIASAEELGVATGIEPTGIGSAGGKQLRSYSFT
jgi:hypothetical protein